MVFWPRSLEKISLKQYLNNYICPDFQVGVFLMKYAKYIGILLALISIGKLSYAQTRNYKIAKTSDVIKIDGVLNENCWSGSEQASNFTQWIPDPMQPETQKTIVRMCYDETAIYIGAILYQDPSTIRKQLTPRDEIGNSNADVFGVYFDTYKDKQNGFAFKVTAAGSKQEERMVNGGNEGTGDVSWDAVWTSKVRITDSAWIVEMQIPFQAVRFPKNKVQDWGLQFLRQFRSRRERSYWNPVNPRETGFLAQAGALQGIQNVEPPVRLIFFPYLSTGFQRKPSEGGATNQWLRSGGMDVKYGINEAFTFDMTLIPDFSQVISDQLIRNLSAFEQQLTENRPFFTEGVELFNKQGLFYSRRVGGTPKGFNSVGARYANDSIYEIDQNPNVTPLYNSFKISGRTEKKLGIGLFNALATPVKANVINKITGEKIEEETEPLTNYSVFVLDQGLKGQSFINFTNTNVARAGDGLDANVSALEVKLFSKENKYMYRFNHATSFNSENSTGTKWIGRFEKISGKIRLAQHLRYLSPKYDQTNLGLQFDRNDLYSYTQFRYFENKPKAKHLQLYNIYLNSSLSYNAQPYSFRRWEVAATYFMLLKNFWDISLTIENTPFAPINFYQLASFGERIKEFPYLFTNVRGSTDSRKKFFWAWNYGFGKGTIDPNPNYITLSNTLRYRFNDHLEISTTYSIENNESNIGYSFYDNALDRPIVAFRDIKQQTAQINLAYNFSPKLNLTGRFRHYNSKINNKSLHTTSANGSWQNNVYIAQAAADYNENYNLQNVDVFLNWIYAPGSRMILSYKQWLNDSYILNDRLENSFSNNLFQVIERPKAFEVSLRFIYYLDYNRMKQFIKGNKIKNLELQ